MVISYGLTIKQTLFKFFVSVFALAAALAVFGVQFSGLLEVSLTVIAIAMLQFLLQPLFSLFTKILGVIGIIIVSLLSSTLIIWFALALMIPGVSSDPLEAILIGWVYALFVTLAHWIVVSQSDDVFLSEILRTNRYKKAATPTEEARPGFLFVQLDGVPAPVLDWQLKAGNLPNIRRLLEDEGYVFSTWKTQLPSTTPASQAGILLGSSEDIPAFRWYEKDRKKLVVANQFEGAALIEKRLSTGNGLLADGGVSVGNLFTGDAQTNIMVMSRLNGDRESFKNIRGYTAYFSSPYGFMRSTILSFGEMIKELYQARRQEARDVQPRIKRHGSYVLLRAATNVLLRNLQTTIVIDNMLKGKNAIYVDFLDYDEIGHHAGFARPESLASLVGLDRVLGLICRARSFAPRPYEIVILSDHGQSQGATFKQLHNGKTLESYVAELSNSTAVEASTEPVESESTARSLFSETTKSKGIGSATMKRFERLLLKPKAEKSAATQKNNLVVTGSGNLGNIWLNEIKGRATRRQIDEKYPELIQGLLRTKGVGLLLVKTEKSFVCLTKSGTLDLKTGKITGDNPLAQYPDVRRVDLLRLVTMRHSPDIAVLSSCDPNSGQVHAFEELVGNHGGIGGWQRDAILLHPKRFEVQDRYIEDGFIRGADNLHKVLKSWLTQ